MTTEEASESFFRFVATALVDRTEPHLKRYPPGEMESSPQTDRFAGLQPENTLASLPDTSAKPPIVTVDRYSLIPDKPCNKSLRMKGPNDEAPIIEFRFYPSNESQCSNRGGRDPLLPLTLANDILLYLNSIMPFVFVDWIDVRLFIVQQSTEEFVMEYPLFLRWIELVQGNVTRLHEHIHGIVSECYRTKGSGHLRFRPIIRTRSEVATDAGQGKALSLQPIQPAIPPPTLDAGFFVQNIIDNYKN
ncbi:hypothetical protein N7513_003501 [Penicillium frequentans]|nr:hypothetical protein N7513_003501 [Penicillium glabrum]